MTNEIAATELKFSADITPSTIEIFNYDVLKEGINEVVKKYDGLVLTAADIKDAKEIKTKLNKLNKAMNDRRIEIKKAVNVPLDEFEAKIKALTNEVNRVLAPISESIKLAEEGERLQRESEINKMIREMVTPLNYTIEQININEKWYNKTAKVNDVKKEVEYQIKELDEIGRRLKEDTTAVNSYANANNIESDAYIMLLEEGFQLSDVFLRIDKEKDRRESIKKAEEARKIREQQMIEEQKERDLKIKEAQELQEQEVKERKTEFETTEYAPFEEKSAVVTNVIEVTATIEQLQALNEYMKMNKIKVSGHACTSPEYRGF